MPEPNLTPAQYLELHQLYEQLQAAVAQAGQALTHAFDSRTLQEEHAFRRLDDRVGEILQRIQAVTEGTATPIFPFMSSRQYCPGWFD